MENWLNRVGILLGFFSFWFAAPEFIGEARLREWETRLEKAVVKAPDMLDTIIVFAPILLIVSALIASRFAAVRAWIVMLEMDHRVLYFAALGVLMIGFIALIRHEASIYQFVKHRIVPRILGLLADDKRIRARALVIGAFLFVLSTMFQLAATFIK